MLILSYHSKPDYLSGLIKRDHISMIFFHKFFKKKSIIDSFFISGVWFYIHSFYIFFRFELPVTIHRCVTHLHQVHRLRSQSFGHLSIFLQFLPSQNNIFFVHQFILSIFMESFLYSSSLPLIISLSFQTSDACAYHSISRFSMENDKKWNFLTGNRADQRV